MQDLIKYFFLPILSSLYYNFSFSQETEIDSLKKLVFKIHDKKEKVFILNSLAEKYEERNLDSSMKFAQTALEISRQEGNKTGAVGALQRIGNVYFNRGDFQSSLEYFRQSEKLCRENNDTASMGSVIGNIANVYGAMGDYASSLKYQLEALSIKEKVSDTLNIPHSYMNISTIYFYLKNYNMAMEYAVKGRDAYKRNKNISGFSTALTALGNIYHALGDADKGLSSYLESMKLKEEINDKSGIARLWVNIGNIYYDQQNWKKVSECDSKAIRLLEELGDKPGLASAYNNAGETFLMLKDYDKAIMSHTKALDVAREINSREDIMRTYQSLATAYAETKHYRESYDYHVKYVSLKDSIFNEESSGQIAEMQTKYETEKKEQQITLLNKDKELQDAQLNRQKIIIWSVAGGLLVVLILSIFIFRERRKSEKLLLNILPAETARELKTKGKAKAKHYESVTVMFTDFKGFTTIAEKLSAEELVSELDFLFKKFDEIISKYSIEKIKTIGDAYMCASGLPTPNLNHAENTVKASIEIQNWMKEQNNKWQLRIGIHSGPVTAGVVGDKKFAYDIWGDTVNTASRMESSGEAGKINISGNTYELVKDKFTCEFRGRISAKNKGEIEMYFVERNVT